MSKKTIKKTETTKASSRAKRIRTAEAAEPEVAREILSAAAPPSLEQIRDRAYQIFRTGVNPSDPAADWFQAERELKSDARV
jgi:hypothetical protein